MLSYFTQWFWEEETANATSEKEKEEKVFSVKNEDDWVHVERASPRSSVSELPSDSDDSWIVAPPSCLSREDPASEAGSLEDLLIEHPSMSVYQHRTDGGAELVGEVGEETVQPTPLEPSVPDRHQSQMVRMPLPLPHHQQQQVRPQPPVPHLTVVPRACARGLMKAASARAPKLTRGGLKRHNQSLVDCPRRRPNKNRGQKCHIVQPKHH